MVRTKAALVMFLFLACSQVAHAQFSDTFHIFPQFVDGRFPDGAHYKATLMIDPVFDNSAVTCSFNLFGMTAAFDGVAPNSVFTVTIPANGFIVERTTGQQSLAFGYATLTCSSSVYAQVLYALYNSGGVKAGEATIFSAFEQSSNSFLADQREGAAVGVAIANNTDSPHTYTVTARGTFGTRTGTIQVAARRNVAAFVNQIVINMPANAVAKVEIVATDFSNAAVIAFRITDLVFTTIPAN
jgi:hypothetical protein